MNRQQLNITVGSDVILNVTLVHEEEVLIPALIDNLEANLISGLGKRTALETGLGADYITIAIPWVEGRLAGCHSLEVKGSTNGLAWAAIGKGLIRYTNATEAGADSVTVEADAYDVTMEVGYHYSDSPIARVEATIDSQVGEPEVGIRYAARVLSLAFRNIKGNGIASIIKETDNTGDEAVNTWRINLDNGQFALLSLQNGSRGNGIASITPVSISQEDGGVSSWSINETDGRSTLFYVRNGNTGPAGPQGASAVFDPETGNILATLHNTTGQDDANAMTQKAVTDELRNITDAVVKAKTTSDIIYNAGRVNVSNWNSRNSSAENPSDGFYMNVVAYRGMRVKITPQSGKRVRVGFTQNILIKSGASTTGDYALVDGTSVSNGTAIVYADGYSDVIYPAANVAIDVVIPNNCNYLWCSYLYASSGDMRPASIEFFESKTINILNTELREAINASAEETSANVLAAAENSIGLVNFHPTTEQLGVYSSGNGYYIAKENGLWLWKADNSNYAGRTLAWSDHVVKGMSVLVVPQENQLAYIAFVKSSPIHDDGVAAGDEVEFCEGWERVKVDKPTVFTVPTDEGNLRFFYLVKYNGSACGPQYYQRGRTLDYMIIDSRNRISNLEYISISAGELSDKTVKQGYRVVINGKVDNKGTAGTAVLIPNTGYSIVSIDATYWTSSIAAIAFYNNTSASSSNLISAVEMVSGTTHYEQDVPDGCELIGFTYKTSSDSIDNITLYINSIERIKNLGKNLPSSASLDRGVLLNQARAVTPTPVTLLHISDVHGNTQALQAIRNFYEEYSNYIDDIINTGDLATNTYNTTDADNYNNIGYTDALFAIGNHDGATSTGSTKAEWIAAGREACYNTYFSNIGEWGVVQPEGASENHLMYYYKDYTEAKVRLIVLDCMFDTETVLDKQSTYSADQYNWFLRALRETVMETIDDAPNPVYGYTVVIASHYIPGNYFEKSLVRNNDETVVSFHTGGNATPRHYNGGYVYDGKIDERFKMDKKYPEAVQNFISGTGAFQDIGKNGNFAIWLCGHFHWDFIAYAWNGFTDNLTDNGNVPPSQYLTEYKITGMNGGQPVVEAVQTPLKYPVSDVLFSAVTRAAGTGETRTLDEFFPAANAVTITSTYIKIIRFGFSLTTSLRPMNVLVYNFKTKKVIENY